MSDLSYYSRPPIGFIVEGGDEYNSYPTLFSKIVETNGLNVPRINARGCGNIIKHLEEHVSDLVLTHKPVTIIVTIDLKDAIYSKIVNSCTELCNLLSDRLDEWFKDNSQVPKYKPLPERYSVIIQIPKFESWIAADKHSLRKNGFIVIPEDDAEWANVDDEIGDPYKWLCDVSDKSIDLKQPEQCKMIISCINIDVAKNSSPSFAKFYRELRKHYGYYQNKCGLTSISIG